MAEDESREPLIDQLHVGPGGRAVVAGTIANLHVHPQPGSEVASLDPFATVPPLPPGFLPRPEVTETIIHSLSGSDTVAITAVEGMGGVGKTIVANELCHDPRIRDTFKDGILWFTIGKQSGLTPETLTREMAMHLNQEFRVSSEAAYRSLFRGKSVLVVLDDVWTLDAIEPFLLDSGSSRLLYTTRNHEIAASLVAKNHDVGLLDDAHARRFLAHRSGWEQSPLPEPEATEILSECKGLVLGLAMIGASLKNKPASDWARVVRNLRKAHLNDTGARVANYAYRTLWASIAASVEELSREDRKRYCGLAILLEDMPYPATLLQQIWGGDADEVGDAMNRFVDQSLASRDPEGSIHIHDFQLDFVRGEYPYPAILPLAHLALLRSLHVVRSNPEQFASQMAGRLLSHQDDPEIGKLLERLKANAARACLWPLLPSLEQGGASTRRVLEGHTDAVKAVVLTADGKSAISGSDDSTFRVWDLDGQTPPRVLEDDTGWLGAIAFSADGRRAVSGSSESTRIWDLDGQAPPRLLEGHTVGVNAVALSADGRRAVSLFERRMRVWDLDGQTPPRLLEGPANWGSSVALSADGQRAVSGSIENTVQVWDLDSQTPPRLLRGHTEGVEAVALSADGRRAVSGSQDKTLRVWDLDGQTPPRVLEGHTTQVDAVALSPDGRYAASGSGYTLRVWDLGSQTPPRVLEGHTDWISAIALSADGKRAISGSDDKTLRVWDLDVQTPAHVPEGHTAAVGAVALSADGRRAVSGSDDKTLRVWDLHGQTSPRVLERLTEKVSAVALSADGERAVSLSGGNTLRVWDLNVQTPPRVLEDDAEWIIAIALSADGKRVVSGSDDKTLRVWDLDGQAPPRVLEGHTGSIKAVALSADGRRAVSGSDDKTLRVWDLDSDTAPSILENLGNNADSVRAVALSADGKRAVSVYSFDPTLGVWDIDVQTRTRFLEGHTGRVNSVALSADGRRAVSGSGDKTLRVWDLNSGACVAVFTCDSSVLSCAWRGDHVVAGDQCGRVHFLRWLE